MFRGIVTFTAVLLAAGLFQMWSAHAQFLPEGCPGRWVPGAGGMMCQCPDGSFAGGWPSMICPQAPRCPVGASECANGCCDHGHVCFRNSSCLKKGRAIRDAGAYDGECVEYLGHARGVQLPDHDLSDWDVKRELINVDGEPQIGDVAIIEVPTGVDAQDGHVALVRDVTEVSIQIEEANWRHGRITIRTAIGDDIQEAMQSLHIVGFYRPE
jgi:CHAP domain